MDSQIPLDNTKMDKVKCEPQWKIMKILRNLTRNSLGTGIQEGHCIMLLYNHSGNYAIMLIYQRMLILDKFKIRLCSCSFLCSIHMTGVDPIFIDWNFALFCKLWLIFLQNKINFPEVVLTEKLLCHMISTIRF